MSLPLKPGHSVYRGRFAPSPTGPLHFGSLVGALASYLDAREAKGLWLVRMEDIDPLRERPGAADSILKTLEAHGLLWDEQVLYQSLRSERYQHILNKLLKSDSLYRCPCSRKELAEAQLHRNDCPLNQPKTAMPHSLRFAVHPELCIFADVIQGQQSYSLSRADDFIVKRRDGFYAYQLAVVIDDYEQNISHVIRGIDLLNSTPLQIMLYQSLGWQPPQFGHFPVVVNSFGKKLSKQHLAPGLNIEQVAMNLRHAAIALRLITPQDPLPEKPGDALKLLLSRWSRARYRSMTTIQECQPERTEPTLPGSGPLN